MESRLKQADLWRDDVREAIQLTPEKMEVYLLVIALELNAAAICLCKARVPPGAPPWLVSASVLAICSCLVFLFMGLWFGLHAFVAAQAYKVRILTQLVRLPIPTWSSLEASRTYGSAFESMQTKQMLRVPFITGSQERWVSQRGPSGQTSRGSSHHHHHHHHDALDGAAGDPWGLERTGAHIPELEPTVNSSRIEKQRHVWLIREAAKFYNTYDAFCRVCTSFGTSSLSTFFCFWCLADVCTELAAPIAAWGGMAIFSSISLLLLRTDQALSGGQYLVGSFLLFMPPALCAVVTFMSSKNWGDAGSYEYLMPVGLFLKGCWFFYFLVIFEARVYQTGAVLPSSFKAVLYVDVYGWAKHTSVWWQRGTSQGDTSEAASKLTHLLPASRCAGPGVPTRPEDVNKNQSTRAALARPDLPENVEGYIDEDQDDDDLLGHRPVSFRPGTFTGDGLPSNSSHKHQVGSAVEVTGDRPGIVPWRAFFLMTVLVGSLWWAASVVAFYDTLTGNMLFRGHYGLEPGKVVPLPVLIGSKVTTGWGASQTTSIHGFSCNMDGTIFATASHELSGRKRLLAGHLQAPTSLYSTFELQFEPAAECSDLDDHGSIQDLALHNCEGNSRDCSAIVLPLQGDHLHSCPLVAPTSLAQSDRTTVASNSSQRSIARSWLEDRGGVPLAGDEGLTALLHPEEMTSLSTAPCLAPKGSRSNGQNCLVIGTTARRIVQLDGENKVDQKSTWMPRRLLQKLGPEVPGPGSFAMLDDGRYLGVLHRHADEVRLLDLQAGGKPVGMWKLPSPADRNERWAGICAGGGTLYALQAGDQPSIWRFPHPTLPKKEIATTL